MAFTASDIINVEVLDEVRGGLEDHIARSNPMLAAVEKRAVATQQIFLPNKATSDHNAGAIADGATVTPAATAKTTYLGATVDWATYKADFSVNKRLISQLSSQPSALGSLLYEEIKDAAEDLADKIAQDMFAPQAGNALIGLPDWMDDGNTLGGIDRSLAANSWWRGLVYDASPDAGTTAGSLSTTLFDLVDELYFGRTKANFFGNAQVSGVGFVPKRLLTLYKQLFTSIDISSLATAHFVNQANSTGMFGQNMLGYNGVPFIPDANVTTPAGDVAGSIRGYMVKPSEVFLATLDDTVPAEVKAMQQLGNFAAGKVTRDGIRLGIEILGNSGEVISGYVKAYVQLVVPRPGFAGVAITNVGSDLP